MSDLPRAGDEAAFLAQLGVRVRRARSKLGLTRRELARRSGVSERYLAQLESGRGNISVLLIRRVGVALATDLQELVGQTLDGGRRGRIALIGMRGAGKSTLGATLAAQLGVPCVELSAEIERDAGTPIAAIVAGGGQEAYRNAERGALARVVETIPRCVIVSGGSIVIEPSTYLLLRGRCTTVWLRASPEELLARMLERDDALLARGREQVLLDLRLVLAQRERLYAQADLVVDTGSNDLEQCVRLILERVGDLSSPDTAAS